MKRWLCSIPVGQLASASKNTYKVSAFFSGKNLPQISSTWGLVSIRSPLSKWFHGKSSHIKSLSDSHCPLRIFAAFFPRMSTATQISVFHIWNLTSQTWMKHIKNSNWLRLWYVSSGGTKVLTKSGEGSHRQFSESPGNCMLPPKTYLIDLSRPSSNWSKSEKWESPKVKLQGLNRSFGDPFLLWLHLQNTLGF